MLWSWFMSFLFVFLLRKIANPFETVTVEISKLGKVAGKREGPVISFLGIPYAMPPVGRLRFRPPLPADPWAPNVLKAFNFSASCHQSALYSVSDDVKQSEDCLYLNIWYPAKSKDQSALPVLLWVHGGAFQQGSTCKAEYTGDKLAARGVVVISINYRLGSLGFLVSTSDGLYG
jgi:para-nitrobenzyl esterase